MLTPKISRGAASSCVPVLHSMVNFSHPAAAVAHPLQFHDVEDTNLPRDMKEPQSYGSERDWVTGHTGQQPNDPAATPPASQADFYDDRRDSEESNAHQGGDVSPEQLAETANASAAEGERSPAPITQTPGGAKRGGYFKERDYR